MSTFASDIQIVCLGTLALLTLYTLMLSRYRGLDGHLTVRWLLILGAAFLTIVFWRWLPFFNFTSSMQERELLLMMTVLTFAFVIFLMLDLLVRSSRQSEQIKRLTQELAIQRTRMDLLSPPDGASTTIEPLTRPARPSRKTDPTSILAGCWILMCIGFFIVESVAYSLPIYPAFLRSALSAAYLQ